MDWKAYLAEIDQNSKTLNNAVPEVIAAYSKFNRLNIDI